MTSDKLYTIFLFALTLGCHLALLAVCSFLFFRTKRAGFLSMAIGFTLALIQPLALWFLSPHFSESVERLIYLERLISFIYPLSLIMILIGFYKLFISRKSRYE